MANAEIGIGIDNTINPVPFGYWVSDAAWRADADRTVVYVLRRLGEDFLSVELTKKMIWTAFEEATLALNAAIIEYQAKSNLTSLLGTPTASIDPNTGIFSGSVNYTNMMVYPTLEWLTRQAEPYMSSIGYGQSQDTYTGSIDVQIGQQDYDLYTDLKDVYGVPLYQYNISGSTGPMKIVDVFHLGPSNFMFNSNYMLAHGLAIAPNEAYIRDSSYYMLPVFQDVLRGTMIQTAQDVRMSHYRYRVSGRNLRIFPTPRTALKLWIRVMFPMSTTPGIIPDGVQASGSYFLTGNGTPGQIIPGFGQNIFVASNPANIAAGFINYSSMNPWARNWIFQYTLAICKEMVGLVRTKFKTFPIPGAELQLNGDDLMNQSKEEKSALLFGDGGLYTKLDGLTFDKLAEKEASRAESIAKQMSYLAIPPAGLSWT